MKLNKIIISLSNTDYLETIKSSLYSNLITEAVNLIFDGTVPKDLGYALMFSYYLSHYKNNIFKSIMISDEEKLICASNKVVEILCNIQKIELNKIGEFIYHINNYYALYKLWISKDSLEKIETLFNYLTELCYNSEISHDIKCNENIFKSILRRMMDISIGFTVKIIIGAYDIIYPYSYMQNEFWNNIKNMNINDCNILIILLAELRIKILDIFNNRNNTHNTHNIINKKDIYYKIDIDNIVVKVMLNKLENSDVIYAIELLIEKINKLYGKEIIKNNLTNDNFNYDVINKFQEMYYYVYKYKYDYHNH